MTVQSYCINSRLGTAMSQFLDKSIFLESQDVNWETAKNVLRY